MDFKVPDPHILPLNPKWKPLVAKGFAQFGRPMLPLTIFDDIVIVAGYDRLHLFQVLKAQRHWFTIEAAAAIRGYGVYGTNLYVTDGTVISCWDLDGGELPICVSATDLVSGASLSATAGPITPEKLAALQSRKDVVLSAPMVRQHRDSARPGNLVFVYGSNASLYAMDDGLKVSGTGKIDHPIEADLSMMEVETPAGSSNYRCFLFTIASVPTGEYRVVAINGDDLQLLPYGQGAFGGGPEMIAPYVADGLVIGSGYNQPGFWVAPPPPGFAPILSYEGGWSFGTELDVSPPEKLILLTRWSDGPSTSISLLSYAVDGQRPDRNDEVTTAPTWARFWPDSENTKMSPRLIFQVDRAPAASGGNIGYCVSVANTIVPSDNAVFPVPSPLVKGAIEPGAFKGLMPEIDAILAAPVFKDDEVYLLAETRDGNAALICCSLHEIAPVASSLGAAELKRIAYFNAPIRIKVETRRPQFRNEDGSASDLRMPVPNKLLRLQHDAVGLPDYFMQPTGIEFTTDGKGEAIVNAILHGATANVNRSMAGAYWPRGTAGTCVLDPAKLNILTIDGDGPVQFRVQTRQQHHVSTRLQGTNKMMEISSTTEFKPAPNTCVTFTVFPDRETVSITTDANGMGFLGPELEAAQVEIAEWWPAGSPQLKLPGVYSGFPGGETMPFFVDGNTVNVFTIYFPPLYTTV